MHIYIIIVADTKSEFGIYMDGPEFPEDVKFGSQNLVTLYRENPKVTDLHAVWSFGSRFPDKLARHLPSRASEFSSQELAFLYQVDQLLVLQSSIPPRSTVPLLLHLELCLFYHRCHHVYLSLDVVDFALESREARDIVPATGGEEDSPGRNRDIVPRGTFRAVYPKPEKRLCTISLRMSIM